MAIRLSSHINLQLVLLYIIRVIELYTHQRVIPSWEQDKRFGGSPQATEVNCSGHELQQDHNNKIIRPACGKL